MYAHQNRTPAVLSLPRFKHMRLYLVKDHQLIKFIQDDMYMYTSFYFSGLLDKYMYLHAATTVAIHFHMYITKDSSTF